MIGKMKNYEVIVMDRSKVSRPIVYLFYENRTLLYVGYSANGIGRPFDKGHHQREAFEKSTHVEIRMFETKNEALAEEKRLIAEEAPLFNGRGGIRMQSCIKHPDTVRAFIRICSDVRSQEHDLGRDIANRGII